MGLFDFFKGADINKGVEEWKASSHGMLIDVRTADEYHQGHIPGSINIPLDRISTITKKVSKKNTPLFVYCRSGARSSRAVQTIKQMDYTDVKNIGGIQRYCGKVEV